jgi:hypothetical protein
MKRQARVGSHACSGRFKLASPQRVEQIPREYNALALPLSEALVNEVFDASVHRVADLTAESARTQRGRFTSDKLAVEPGGAASLDLRVDGQVGTHRQGDAPAANGILEQAELDDAARGGIARCVEVGEADMVAARPRPKVPLRAPRPDRRWRPPAFSAAASAFAMNGLARRVLPVSRIRPMRTQRSSSRVMARAHARCA